MIATTIEQSKRLLDCGLDPKTADMCYVKQDAITRDDKEKCALYMFAVLKPQAHTYYMTGDSEAWDEVTDYMPYKYKWKDMQMTTSEMKEGDIPAWSLSALIAQMPCVVLESSRDNHYRAFWEDKFSDWHTNAVDACVELLLRERKEEEK